MSRACSSKTPPASASSTRSATKPERHTRAARSSWLAGAIGTPHLLLLSGIGPPQQLRSFEIDVLADLPGVGANLHDHTKSQVSYTTTRPVRAFAGARKPLVLTRTNPAAAPDLQMIFIDSPIHPRFALGPENGFSVLFSVMTPA